MPSQVSNWRIPVTFRVVGLGGYVASFAFTLQAMCEKKKRNLLNSVRRPKEDFYASRDNSRTKKASNLMKIWNNDTDTKFANQFLNDSSSKVSKHGMWLLFGKKKRTAKDATDTDTTNITFNGGFNYTPVTCVRNYVNLSEKRNRTRVSAFISARVKCTGSDCYLHFCPQYAKLVSHSRLLEIGHYRSHPNVW